MSLARFGVRRPVPINILMAIFLIAGFASGLTLTREFFPETSPESAIVSLPYPGATPAELEQSLVIKVEDKLADLDEVERLTTSISEGQAQIAVEFRENVDDVTEATNEVERAIETLTDLPEESERIRVSEFEPRLPVIMISVFGDAGEEALKRAIRQVRDELRLLPGMGEILVAGVRDYEIRVDVSSAALLEHGMSLPDVSNAVSGWMLDLPGGTVRTSVGNINVRTMGTEERGEAIRRIVVKATADGQILRVGDIAEVRETYVDEQIRTGFRTAEGGGPSAGLTVYKVGDQDAVAIAEMARAYVVGRRAASGDPRAMFEPTWRDRILDAANWLRAKTTPADQAPPRLTTRRRQAFEQGLRSPAPLPAGCHIATSSDLARFIEGRLDLLLRNARWGGLLVIATLLVVLNWRTAWWVTVGLTTALAGALLFMKVAGITLNLLTMFGLIVVLGLLVDDAIVVAENVTARHDRGDDGVTAAIKGTEEVFWPVVATILTSIVAFLPLTFVRGQIGDLLGALPWVVACALLMSLVEAVLILPSHLAHSFRKRDERAASRAGSWPRRFERWRDGMIFDRIVPAYARMLGVALRHRYLTLSVAIALLVATVGMVAGARVEFTFIETSDSETIIADLRMPIGTPVEHTARVVERIETAAAAQPEVRTINTLVGLSATVDDTSGITSAGRGSHRGQLFVELLPVEERDLESARVIDAIRTAVGEVEGVDSLSFSEIQAGPGGRDITIQVTGEDETTVDAVVGEVKTLLADLEGVFDIDDNNELGQREVQINLKPGAAALGFTVEEVARQVRGALFGIDAHVFSASREDIDVRVRLDEPSRRSLQAIEQMWIIGAAGERVPLQEIARISEGYSYSTIRRVDRRRAITVTADTTPEVNPERVVTALMPSFKQIERRHPAVGIELAGRQRQLRKAFESLPIGFLTAMILIYIILAWLFSSYTQPIAVMFAIPFGFFGVVWGHALLGYTMTFLSLIGFVALSGIVVNDSLILVQFYNTKRDEGLPLLEALLEAGRQRLRPIFLTTITTVLGLTPLMLERSFQAKFLIPMAISIAFGLMAATVLILFVLPCIIFIVDDMKAAGFLLWHGRPRPRAGAAPAAG